jgi:hypothetical protein
MSIASKPNSNNACMSYYIYSLYTQLIYFCFKIQNFNLDSYLYFPKLKFSLSVLDVISWLVPRNLYASIVTVTVLSNFAASQFYTKHTLSLKYSDRCNGQHVNTLLSPAYRFIWQLFSYIFIHYIYVNYGRIIQLTRQKQISPNIIISLWNSLRGR